jgi:hypothetical protein
MATKRFSRVSRARYTSPMPPAPRAVTISYGPSLVPADRSITGAHYSAIDYAGRCDLGHCLMITV